MAYAKDKGDPRPQDAAEDADFRTQFLKALESDAAVGAAVGGAVGFVGGILTEVNILQSEGKREDARKIYEGFIGVLDMAMLSPSVGAMLGN